MNLRNIDEVLVRQAKMAAIARGTSLTEFVEEALERALAKPSELEPKRGQRPKESLGGQGPGHRRWHSS